MGNQQTESEGNRGSVRGRFGHGFFTAQRVALRAVAVALLCGVPYAVPAAAQTMLFSGERFNWDPLAEPSHENRRAETWIPEPSSQPAPNLVQSEPRV
jgi:hypothetical protein